METTAFHAITDLERHIDQVDDIVEVLASKGPILLVLGAIAIWFWPGTPAQRDLRQWGCLVADGAGQERQPGAAGTLHREGDFLAGKRREIGGELLESKNVQSCTMHAYRIESNESTYHCVYVMTNTRCEKVDFRPFVVISVVSPGFQKEDRSIRLAKALILWVFLGGPPGIRTLNLRIKSPLLCR